MEKETNLLVRGTWDWNVWDYRCGYSLRKLNWVRPLHGMGQRKWRGMDKIRWWYSIPTTRREGDAIERWAAKLGNSIHAFVQKDFHKTTWMICECSFILWKSIILSIYEFNWIKISYLKNIEFKIYKKIQLKKAKNQSITWFLWGNRFLKLIPSCCWP